MVLFTYFMQSIDIHLIFVKIENSLIRKSSLFFDRELFYMLFLTIGIMLTKRWLDASWRLDSFVKDTEIYSTLWHWTYWVAFK